MKVKDENYRKILRFIFVVLFGVEILIDLINVVPYFCYFYCFLYFHHSQPKIFITSKKTKTKNPFACFELKSNKTILSKEEFL
jgi:hypothetical protein